MVVVAVATVLLSTGAVPGDEMPAPTVTWPAAVVVTATLAVAVASLASALKSQSTRVCAWVVAQLPPALGVTVPTVPPVNISVRRAVAAFGPRFCTVAV